MPFTLKLLIFWICVGAIFLYIRLYPRSFTAKFLLSRQGPIPKVNETEPAYLLRYGFWALRWFAALAIVWIIGAYLFSAKMGESTILMVIFAFTIPILAAMALLGSILIFLNSLLCWRTRIKKVFKVPPGDFVKEEDNVAA